jgi:hypothetical protein
MSRYFSPGSSGTLKRARKMLGLKPHLSYLELHLTDHCNLNCKGCGHFAPIADKWFADLHDYERDLKQLQRLFSSIRKIRLMGGEPLLNPQIEAFMFATRAVFPNAKIRVCTNGILLPKMPEKFWDACRTCSVGIDLSVYPPLKADAPALVRLVEGNGLTVNASYFDFFHAFYNRKGDTDKKVAFKRCREREDMPMLREGKIYVCPKPATMFYFNEKYGLSVPRTGFVDIYTPGLNGWDVISRLNEAPTTCSYCTLGWDVIPVFPWSASKLVLDDWDASTCQASKKDRL